MTTRTDRPGKWIDGPTAAALLGVDLADVETLAAEGLIGLRPPPPRDDRFRMDDVEGLARLNAGPAPRTAHDSTRKD